MHLDPSAQANSSGPHFVESETATAAAIRYKTDAARGILLNGDMMIVQVLSNDYNDDFLSSPHPESVIHQSKSHHAPLTPYKELKMSFPPPAAPFLASP